MAEGDPRSPCGNLLEIPSSWSFKIKVGHIQGAHEEFMSMIQVVTRYIKQMVPDQYRADMIVEAVVQKRISRDFVDVTELCVRQGSVPILAYE